MTRYLPWPASRADLPRDGNGQPFIDERFDLLGLYQDTLAACAQELAYHLAGFRSDDSIDYAAKRLDWIALFTEAVGVRDYPQMNEHERASLCELATAIVACRPVGGEECIHYFCAGDEIPGPLGPLVYDDDEDACPGELRAEEERRAVPPVDPAERLWSMFRARGSPPAR